MVPDSTEFLARVRAAVEWYRQAQPLYAQLAQVAASLVEKALAQHNIPYHSVAWRAKSVASFEKKALTRRYLDPCNHIRDLAGIRITTFVLSDAAKACRMVEQLFTVLELEDKAQCRQVGSFGYRSVHYIACLPATVRAEADCAAFADMPLEIQVRTLLQHSWAEIEHDRNYKFEGTLPAELQHRFAMLAAVLELADREFDSIARDIDAYRQSVKARAAQGNLDIPLNTTSLREFLQTKLAALCPLPLQPRFATRRDAEEIVRELSGMGIDTLAKLDAIIPPDFVAKAAQYLKDTTLAGIVRDLLILHNADAYFRVTRGVHSQPLSEESLRLFAAYGLDPALIRQREAALTSEAFWREMQGTR